MDPFKPYRSTRGALPTREVRLVGEGTPSLVFGLVPPDEMDDARRVSDAAASQAGVVAGSPLIDLAACGRPHSGTISKDDMTAFARAHGPLFGLRMHDGNPSEAEEGLAEWASAIQMANLAVCIQEVVNDDMPIEGLSTLGNLVKRHETNAVTGAGFDLFEVSRLIPGQYGEMLDDLPLVRRSRRGGRFLYSFAVSSRDEEAGEVLDFVVVSLPHEMTSLDYQALSQALDFGVEVDDLARSRLGIVADEGGDFRLAGHAELSGEDVPVVDGDRDALMVLVQTVVAAHLLGARVDVFQADDETGFISFGCLLGWLWYDFSRELDAVRIGYCEECGRPFSLVGHRGIARRFCSRECKTKSKNDRIRRRRDEMRERFMAGEDVCGLAAWAYPDDALGAARVRDDLSSWPRLKHELDDSIARDGWKGSALLVRCQKERLDMEKLLPTRRQEELRAMRRRS